jgi:nucleotide-binding universal stress UspA family protein
MRYLKSVLHLEQRWYEEKPMMYRRILVPLDGSLFGEQALDQAVSIATAFNAELHLIQIVTSYLTPPYGIDYTVGETFRDVALREAQEYLDQMRHQLERQLIRPVETKVIEGLVADNIVDYAEFHHCDLIVMATHGRSGLGRWVFGSIAERVLHAAHCPILLVRIHEKELQEIAAEAGIVTAQ